jgi:hypothetical protein
MADLDNTHQPTKYISPSLACVRWLFDNQNDDGGWSHSVSEETNSTILNTAEVLYSLALRERESERLRSAILFLCNQILNNNLRLTRQYAWALIALSTSGFQFDHKALELCISWLSTHCHDKGGWPHRRGCKPSVYTTFIGIRALSIAANQRPSTEINEIIHRSAIQIVNSQNQQDGGWGFAVGQQSDPCATAYCVLSLIESNIDCLDSPCRKGIDYLKETQMENGLWNDSIEQPSTVNGLKRTFTHFTTVWALSALEKGCSFDDDCALNALRGLFSLQNSDGSWRSCNSIQTPWTTSQVLCVLYQYEDNFLSQFKYIANRLQEAKRTLKNVHSKLEYEISLGTHFRFGTSKRLYQILVMVYSLIALIWFFKGLSVEDHGAIQYRAYVIFLLATPLILFNVAQTRKRKIGIYAYLGLIVTIATLLPHIIKFFSNLLSFPGQ